VRRRPARERANENQKLRLSAPCTYVYSTVSHDLLSYLRRQDDRMTGVPSDFVRTQI